MYCTVVLYCDTEQSAIALCYCHKGLCCLIGGVCKQTAIQSAGILIMFRLTEVALCHVQYNFSLCHSIFYDGGFFINTHVHTHIHTHTHTHTHTGRDLQEKYPIPDRVHVTALMASSGFFWIGTSVGILMVYRIPLIEGIPLVTAKPYLAMDGHKGSVRVILTVRTSATMSSTRVGQFLSAEQRSSGHRYTAIEEDGGGVRGGRLVSGGGVRNVVTEEVDGDSLSPIGSPSPPEIEKIDDERRLLEDSEEFVANSNEVTAHTDDDWTQKSSTPSLPNPSMIELEASVYEDDLITPEQSDEDEVDMAVINGVNDKSVNGQGVEDGFVDTNPQSVEGEENGELESAPVVEVIPETKMNESLDYLGDEHYEFSEEFKTRKTQSPDVSIPPKPPRSFAQSNTSMLQPDSNPPTSPHIHYMEDLEESVSSMTTSGDYASLVDATEMVNLARGFVSRADTAEAVERHRARDIYLASEDSVTSKDSVDSSNYNTPHELDALTMRRVPSDESEAVTMRRVPSDELIARMKAERDDDGSTFDEPYSNLPITRKQSNKPNPYEDPATLDRAGTFTARLGHLIAP